MNGILRLLYNVYIVIKIIISVVCNMFVFFWGWKFKCFKFIILIVGYCYFDGRWWNYVVIYYC